MNEEGEAEGGVAKCCSCRSLTLPVSLAVSQQKAGEQRDFENRRDCNVHLLCNGLGCQVKWAAGFCCCSVEVRGSMRACVRWHRTNRRTAVARRRDVLWNLIIQGSLPLSQPWVKVSTGITWTRKRLETQYLCPSATFEGKCGNTCFKPAQPKARQKSCFFLPDLSLKTLSFTYLVST